MFFLVSLLKKGQHFQSGCQLVCAVYFLCCVYLAIFFFNCLKSVLTFGLGSHNRACALGVWVGWLELGDMDSIRYSTSFKFSSWSVSQLSPLYLVVCEYTPVTGCLCVNGRLLGWVDAAVGGGGTRSQRRSSVWHSRSQPSPTWRGSVFLKASADQLITPRR